MRRVVIDAGVLLGWFDAEGYLYVQPIGGWDPQVLVGQRIRLLTRSGDVVAGGRGQRYGQDPQKELHHTESTA